MPEPIHSGRLCGYDVGIRNPDTGSLQIDGKIDELHYEINADNTGRVYLQNADGTQTIITDDVVFTDILGAEYVMQFTADAEITVKGQHIAPDKKGDVVVIRWHPERDLPISEPQIQTYFFKDTPTFEAIIASEPEWANLVNAAIYAISKNPTTGQSISSRWGKDVDGDGTDDPYDLEIYGGHTFMPISSDTPFGTVLRDGDGTYNARICIEFSATRCK